MGDSETVAREALAREIVSIVAEARAGGRMLRTGLQAARLFAAYPEANRSVGHIIDQLTAEAVAAGVAFEN
jgi:hypothetical protein